MRDITKEIAALICDIDGLSRQKWLCQEVTELATSIAGLDELSKPAIFSLAHIVAYGESDARRLMSYFGISQIEIENALESLCEFKFVEKTSNGYTATLWGEKAFNIIGRQMVEREHFELRRRLQPLEELRKQLSRTCG